MELQFLGEANNAKNSVFKVSDKSADFRRVSLLGQLTQILSVMKMSEDFSNYVNDKSAEYYMLRHWLTIEVYNNIMIMKEMSEDFYYYVNDYRYVKYNMPRDRLAWT